MKKRCCSRRSTAVPCLEVGVAQLDIESFGAGARRCVVRRGDRICTLGEYGATSILAYHPTSLPIELVVALSADGIPRALALAEAFVILTARLS